MAPDALELTDKIGAHESGGMTVRGENCDSLKGQSREVGCFQYLLKTWNARSEKYLGYVAEPTYANQRYVTARWVQDELEVMSERKFLWRYNGTDKNGNCHAGVNSLGVKYDSCAYAEMVLAIKTN